MRKKHSGFKTKQLLTSVSLAGSLLLTAGSEKLPALAEKPPELRLSLGLLNSEELKKLLQKLLSKNLPQSSRVLTAAEEARLTKTIKQVFNVQAVAELDGVRLNHQIGLIGLEQYLKRFPGDTVNDRNFPQVGIAPSRGAWGYFAPSKNLLTAVAIQREKYYVAVQTLYLPNWQTKHQVLKNWFGFRKVMVVNPENGTVVVAVVADAGPAKWTGKQFGGSPQVMHDLGLYPKKTKGRVVILFIDDPKNEVPLGPLTGIIGKTPAVI